MPQPIPRSAIRAGFWLACATVAAGSLTPAEHLPPLAFDLWDKAQHAGAFAVMTLLALAGYGNARLLSICGGLLAYGAAIEFGQWLTGWRLGELLDLAADAVGIACGLGLYHLLRRRGRFAGEQAQ